MRVEYIGSMIRQATADRHRGAGVRRRIAAMHSGDHRILGRAVGVEQRAAGRPAPHQRRRHRFTAGDQHPQAGQRRGVRQRRQHHRRQQRVGDADLRDEVFQRVADQHHARRGHVQRSAVGQRHQPLEHAGVETEGRELQHAAVGRHREQIRLHLQQVGGAAVRHQHALRPAGGARGVDHVRRMRRCEADLRGRDVVRRPPGPLRAVGIDLDHPLQERALQKRPFRHLRRRSIGRCHCGGQHTGAVGIDQHHRRFRIDQHVAQAVAGIAGIHRHIRAAGLQHSEHRGDPGDRTLHADADERAGADTAFAQRVGKAVGAGIEFAVIDGIAFAARRQRIRRARGVLLEPRVHRSFKIVIGDRAVAVRRRRPFLGRQRLEAAQRRVGRGEALVEHAQIAVAQTFDGLAPVQILRVGPQQGHAVGVLEAARDHHHVEVELRGTVAVGLVQIQLETRAVQRRHVGVVRAEGHLEQRVAADLALRLQGAHHPLERYFLVFVAGRQRVHRPRQQRAVAGIAGHAGAHRDGVHEHAEHALGAVRTTVGDRGTDQEIVATRVGFQHDLEHRLHRGIQGHAFGFAEAPQFRRQVG